MSTFINISNHPSSNWSEKQLQEAREYGPIVDMEFPQVDPMASEEEIAKLAESFAEEVKVYGSPTVMVQGEFTFSYALIKRLKAAGITVVAACTRREAKEIIMPDGTVSKTSIFEFCGFRKYD